MNQTYIPGVYARQCLAAVVVTLLLADFVANNGVIDVPMPSGAQLVGGDVVVNDTFDGGTTDTIAVGTPDSAERYLAAHDTKTAGRTALVPTGYQHLTSGDDPAPPVRLTRATTGTAATKGTVTVTLTYTKAEKSEWTEGDFTPVG